jgi:Flp pilus assembly protein TadG
MRNLRRRRYERGHALVEFPLAALALFAAIYGVIDFGRALYSFDIVASAAQVGSRYASLHGSTCSISGCPATNATIQTYVQSQMIGMIDPTQLTVTTTWSTATGCSGSPFQGPRCIVKVVVSYPFVWELVYNKTLTMTSTSEMVIAQ